MISRGFTYAVAFHGFDQAGILIGGTAPDPLKLEIQSALERATRGSRIKVRIAGPDEGLGADDPCNIVNRLSAGGNGIQIEQSPEARTDHWRRIADAVAEVYRPKL